MGRKRLNKKVVVGLTLCGFAMMIGLSLLMLIQLRQRDPQYFVELARQYEEDEAWQPAALFYHKAWQRSLNPAHLVAQADMLLNEGEVRLALASLRTALVSRPDSIVAHRRRLELLLELARLYDRTDDWKSVDTAAEEFLAVAADKTPADAAMAHNAKGLALIALARQDEQNAGRGEADLRRAVALAPEHVAFALDLAGYLVEKGRFEEAQGLFDDLLERYATGPDASAVHVAYARYLSSRARAKEAEKHYTKGLLLASENPEALQKARIAYGVFLARTWAEKKRGMARAASGREGNGPDDPQGDKLFEQAEEQFQSCVGSQPDDFEPYLHLAALFTAAERYADVVDTCDARLARGFSRRGVSGQRNRLDAFSLMIRASAACVAEAVGAQQSGDQDARQRWLQRAEAYLADARGEFPSHPRVLNQAGRIKLARGLDREALEDLRAAEEAYKAQGAVNWDNKIMLARLHLRLQEAGAARALLENALDDVRRERPGDLTFWSLYAEALVGCGSTDRALAICDQILDAEPQHRDALRIKAAIFERQGRRKEAGQILARLTGDSAFTAIMVAQQHALEGELDQAVAVLRNALEQDPADARLVGATVRLLLRQERIQEAREVVDAALRADPESLQVKRLALLVRDDLTPEARDEAVFGLIQAQEDAYQRSLELTGFYMRRGELDKALRAIGDALEHLTDSDTPMAQNAGLMQRRALLSTQLRLAFELGNDGVMAAARDAAVRFDVDGAGGKSILGLYHMLRKEYELAAKALREASELQPTDAGTLTRLGQCLHLLKRPDEAQAAYERAIRVNPDAGEAYKGLAILAKQRDDDAAYTEALAACRRLIPGDQWVQAEFRAKQEEADPRSAIAEREKRLAQQPDDVDNLKRLAVLYEKVQALPKADECYARLGALLPDDKQMVIVAGRYFRRTGRPEKSLEVTMDYVQSRESAEEKANAQILIASHYLALNKLEQVENTLLAAVKVAETFDVTHSLAEFYLRRLDEPSKALPWYEKAVERARTSRPEEIPRMLAGRISCLIHRRLDDIDTARRYVGELRTEFPDYAEALLLESEVAARSGRLDQAVASLGEYLARRPNDPYALYQRALYHRARGRIAAALQDLQTLKRINPTALDFKPRLLLSRVYLQAGRDKQRIEELESLARDAPDASEVLEELVRAYLDAQRPQDAERIVTAQINRSGDRPNARWLFLRSRIAADTGDPDRALADARRAADAAGHTPDAVARVLDLCARVGRPGDGLEFYRRHAGEAPTRATLISRYALLLAQSGDVEQALDTFRHAVATAERGGASERATVMAHVLAAFAAKEGKSDKLLKAVNFCEEDRLDDPSLDRANRRILARLYRAAKQYDRAAEELERLIADTSEDARRAELLFELAQLHQTAGNPQQARGAYEEGIKYDGDNWIALNNLAYLLSDELGEYQPALSYARNAVAIAENPSALDTLGWIYVGLKDYTLAVAELSRAVQMAPEDPLNYYHLGEAYRRDGQFRSAKEVLDTGRELAEAQGNGDLLARYDESLRRVAESDRTP